jgi:hypothetical protein
MPAKDNDRPVHQTYERVAGVRQGDAVADAGAVKLLALPQRAQEGLASFRLAGDVGDLIDQFG